MNRICGYSCEHNKGGVCQITMCDKQIYITTKTDEPLQKQLEKYTKYKIQKDENFELRKIHELQQELQRKDNIINDVKDIINRMIYMGYCAKMGKGTTATNFMATGENSEFGTRAKYILDKIEELENE